MMASFKKTSHLAGCVMTPDPPTGTSQADLQQESQMQQEEQLAAATAGEEARKPEREERLPTEQAAENA